jgi:hypothetical protein
MNETNLLEQLLHNDNYQDVFGILGARESFIFLFRLFSHFSLELSSNFRLFRQSTTLTLHHASQTIADS